MTMPKPEYASDAFTAAQKQLEDLQLDFDTSPEGTDTSGLRKQIADLEAHIQELLAIAHTEAIAEDAERNSEHFVAVHIPLLKRIEEVVDECLRTNTELPPAISRLGWDIIRELRSFEEMTKNKDEKKQLLPPLSTMEKRFQGIIEAYHVFAEKVRRVLFSQDRYGRDQGAGAAPKGHTPAS